MSGEPETVPATAPPSGPKKSTNAFVVVVVLVVAAVVLGTEYKNGVFSSKPPVQAWTPPVPPTPMPLADVENKLKQAQTDKTITGQGREHLIGYLQGELARSKAVASGQPDPAMVAYQKQLDDSKPH